MESTLPTASSMLGISSKDTTPSFEYANDTITINNVTDNPVTKYSGTTLLSAIFNSTFSSAGVSSSPSAYFNTSLNLHSTPTLKQTDTKNFLNWSFSNQAGHESTAGYIRPAANNSAYSTVSPVSSGYNDFTSRLIVNTTTTSPSIQSYTEETWDKRALIAASLFILALTLVALALRIFCPIYHWILGHNASKRLRDRRSWGRDRTRNTDPYDREEMTPSTNSEEVLIPFGTPATYMKPIMNYRPIYPYHYPLTYMPYQGATVCSPQIYEQDYVINQPIHPNMPQKSSSGEQADRLVEIIEFSSDYMSTGAIYRHNWDQLFDGATNESMVPYVGHPSEYRAFPARHNHNTQP